MPAQPEKKIHQYFFLWCLIIFYLVLLPSSTGAAGEAKDMCCVCEVYKETKNTEPTCEGLSGICGYETSCEKKYTCQDGKMASASNGGICQPCLKKNSDADTEYKKHESLWHIMDKDYRKCDEGIKCQCLDGKCEFKTMCDQYQAALKKQTQFIVPKLNVPIPGLANFSLPVGKEGDFIYFPWLAEYIKAFYKFAISLSGVIAAMMIMAGGFTWLTSGGSSDRITSAKNYIFGAVIGLILALGSYFILNVINPKLTTLSSIGSTIVPIMEGGAGGVAGGPSNPWKGDKNFDKYDAILTNAAKMNRNIDCTFVKSIMLIESHGTETVGPLTNYGRAYGITQMLPFTANGLKQYLKMDNKDSDQMYKEIKYDQLSIKNIEITGELLKNSPTLDIYLGAIYLSRLWYNEENADCGVQNGVQKGTKKSDNLEEKIILTAAAYNGGPKANCWSVDCKGQTWWECVKNPKFSQTRKYTKSALETFNFLLEDREDGNWGCGDKKTTSNE